MGELGFPGSPFRVLEVYPCATHPVIAASLHFELCDPQPVDDVIM